MMVNRVGAPMSLRMQYARKSKAQLEHCFSGYALSTGNAIKFRLIHCKCMYKSYISLRTYVCNCLWYLCCYNKYY